jgi:hypothetical protein
VTTVAPQTKEIAPEVTEDLPASLTDATPKVPPKRAKDSAHQVVAKPIHAAGQSEDSASSRKSKPIYPTEQSEVALIQTDDGTHWQVDERSNGGKAVQNGNENQGSTDGLLLNIRTLGNLLDDLERVRIMNTNRIGALERDFGASLPALDLVQQHLAAVEHEAELELKRMWRKHPLRKWANDYPGVGEKLIARLIAEIGDPGDRPNVAKLWAYCGLGDPARKRKTGMTQEEAFKLGNPKAKKLCWLIGESFVKVNRGPGREHYDAMREKYADRVHVDACKRCGPSGKPALKGSPWSLKHQHEAAKRYAVKMFLKDLWIASRPMPFDNQHGYAGGSK